MAAPRILFVKLSSLGDVVHHLPAVSDLARLWPGVEVGWAVESAYAGLVRLHPAVGTAFPVNLRNLRKRVFDATEWHKLGDTRNAIRSTSWDYVIDTQGLIKSAIVATFAKGARFGLDAASARERIAARFYDVKFPVARNMHAVERNRALVGAVFGYEIDSPADYGLVPPTTTPSWAPIAPYVVMLHAASRSSKLWPEKNWIALGQRLSERGYAVVLPGGSDAERAVAVRMAEGIPGAIGAPASSLEDIAALLAGAWAVAGVDTGLTHLAAALGRPTVGIYCSTDPVLTGLHRGANVLNVGGPRGAPGIEEVAEALGCGIAPTALA